MADLAERIRSYYEAAADPISAGEILAPAIRLEAVRPIPPRIAPDRRRPWPALVGFVAALLAIGSAALLLRAGDVSQTDAASTAATASPIRVEDLVWSRVPGDEAVFGGSGWQGMTSVVVGGPGLVAVGGDDLGEDGDAAVWISADGINWARVPHDEAVFGGSGRQGMESVVVGGPGLVAVGSDVSTVSGYDSDAAVWISADGINWARVPHDEAVFGGSGWQVMESVVAGGPGLVAVGHEDGSGDEWDAAVWTSADGISWSRVPGDEAVFGGSSHQGMTSVVVGGPGLVAVGFEDVGFEDGSGGESVAAVWISADGINWARVPHDESVFGGSVMGSVVVGGPGLVAVGVGSDGSGGDSVAAVWTSADGINWARVPHDESVFGGSGHQGMGSVVVGGPGLVAVGNVLWGNDCDAAVWTSADGINWSRVPGDESAFGGSGWQEMGSVVAGGPGLVAVGSVGSGGDSDAAVWYWTPDP